MGIRRDKQQRSSFPVITAFRPRLRISIVLPRHIIEPPLVVSALGGKEPDNSCTFEVVPAVSTRSGHCTASKAPLRDGRHSTSFLDKRSRTTPHRVALGLSAVQILGSFRQCTHWANSIVALAPPLLSTERVFFNLRTTLATTTSDRVAGKMNHTRLDVGRRPLCFERASWPWREIITRDWTRDKGRVERRKCNASYAESREPMAEGG